MWWAMSFIHISHSAVVYLGSPDERPAFREQTPVQPEVHMKGKNVVKYVKSNDVLFFLMVCRFVWAS